MEAQNAQPERGEAIAIARTRGTVSSLICGPEVLFVLAAGFSFVTLVSLFCSGSREQGTYVGIWVPSILSAAALLLGGSRNE